MQCVNEGLLTSAHGSLALVHTTGHVSLVHVTRRDISAACTTSGASYSFTRDTVAGMYLAGMYLACLVDRIMLPPWCLLT